MERQSVPEMEKLYSLVLFRKNIRLYLPESFEWLILTSGVVADKEIAEILREPESHIESQDYFSWERYFTELLGRKTEGTYLHYEKNRLNPVYLHEKNKKLILDSMKGIEISS